MCFKYYFGTGDLGVPVKIGAYWQDNKIEAAYKFPIKSHDFLGVLRC